MRREIGTSAENKAELLGSFHYVRRANKGGDHPWLETHCSVVFSQASWHSCASVNAAEPGHEFQWIPDHQASSVGMFPLGIRQNPGLLVNGS